MAEDKKRRPFSGWLAGFQNGALDDKLTAALAEVATDVNMLGKSGALTLKITMGKNGDGINVGWDLKTTTPKISNAVFHYVTRDGSLSRRDPGQPSLPGMVDEDADS